MASFFKLTLDTTPPVLLASINAGLPTTSEQLTDVRLLLEELPVAGFQYKIWGDVDAEDNPDIQAEESESNWLSYGEAEEKIVGIMLSGGDGAKKVFAKVRDDVWNESESFELEVELNTSVPVITITSGPSRSKISKVAERDTTALTFKASEDIAEWKVVVVPSEGALEGEGEIIPGTAGSVIQGGEEEAEKAIEASIKGTDLQTAVGGDGQYVIKVFGKSLASGIWSL